MCNKLHGLSWLSLSHAIIMYSFCIAFYSSIDPVKGRGLDEKKHTVAYLLPSKIKNFILFYLILSLSLSLSLPPPPPSPSLPLSRLLTVLSLTVNLSLFPLKWIFFCLSLYVFVHVLSMSVWIITIVNLSLSLSLSYVSTILPSYLFFLVFSSLCCCRTSSWFCKFWL